MAHTQKKEHYFTLNQLGSLVNKISIGSLGLRRIVLLQSVKDKVLVVFSFIHL